MRPLLLALTCLLLPAVLRPALADPTPPPPTNLRPDILYTHGGEFVQVKPMRPLTLNAHVTQFAYDPLGIEIAYVGSEMQGDGMVHFVRTIDTRTGHEMSRLTASAPANDDTTSLFLLGFSLSGKYLLIQRTTADAEDPNTSHTAFERVDLSASPPTSHVVNPQTALTTGTISDQADADGFSSPDNRWIGFRQLCHGVSADGKPERTTAAYFLYDPERDTFKHLTLPPKADAYSWSDSTHLTFYQNRVREQFDINTGEISPLTTPPDAVAPQVSKRYPDLSLDMQNPQQSDAMGSGSYLNSFLLWIRRTPFGKMPLGTAAAGLMPAPANHTVWDDDAPKAVWSPTGKQVAFIANGDLCATALVSAVGAMPHEKLAVGLKLSCEDERDLAVSDLKQIGLGIIQYSQDFDEKYPPAADFMADVYPFVKNRELFQVDGHPFVYEYPAVTLAEIESPATTENGYMDLPCARVVLFCDGHVKGFAK